MEPPLVVLFYKIMKKLFLIKDILHNSYAFVPMTSKEHILLPFFISMTAISLSTFSEGTVEV